MVFPVQDKKGRWVGIFVSSICVGMIALAIYAASGGPEWLGQVFRGFCHQFSDRCYHIDEVAMPVCVRCIWIYAGLAVGHTLFIFFIPRAERITRLLIGVIILMVLDVSLERIGLYHNWFWSRAVTGFLFGLVLSHFTLLGLSELYNKLSNRNSYVRSKFLTGRSR